MVKRFMEAEKFCIREDDFTRVDDCSRTDSCDCPAYVHDKEIPLELVFTNQEDQFNF